MCGTRRSPGAASPTTRVTLPAAGRKGTVGVLVGRSYLLAGNTAHYAAIVAAFEARGLRVIPAFASALDARPAIERFFQDRSGRPLIDAMVNLTGFSLVGGPAYNDSAAAQEVLTALDVPYISLQTLEFQTIEEWRADARGLNPLQATLQVAIPELDGAIVPTVFGGKGRAADGSAAAASEPIAERVERVAERVSRLVALRRTPRAERKVAIILFNFPPNAGNTGSAAYLAVFPSLQRTLAALKEQGYTVELPSSADELRERIINGNREQYGAPANVHTRIPTDDHVRRERWLAGDREHVGTGARQAAHRRPVAVRDGAAARQRVHRRAAVVRLGRRSDAPALRRRLLAHARVQRLLSLAGARTTAPIRCCTSARTARSSSCPASRPASTIAAGRIA